MTDHKQPTAGFWITVTLVAVLVGYPLSFGPASRFLLERPYLRAAYRPLVHLAIDGPKPVQTPLRWWVGKCGGVVSLMLIELKPFQEEGDFVLRSR